MLPRLLPAADDHERRRRRHHVPLAPYHRLDPGVGVQRGQPADLRGHQQAVPGRLRQPPQVLQAQPRLPKNDVRQSNHGAVLQLIGKQSNQNN